MYNQKDVDNFVQLVIQICAESNADMASCELTHGDVQSAALQHIYAHQDEASIREQAEDMAHDMLDEFVEKFRREFTEEVIRGIRKAEFTMQISTRPRRATRTCVEYKVKFSGE